MNFKKPKQQVIDEAYYASDKVLSRAFYDLKHGIVNSPAGSNIEAIYYAMSQAIRSAVTSLVENTYTDQEFEEDLGLREKNDANK